MAARRIEITIRVSKLDVHIFNANQLLVVRVHAIAKIRNASPNRLVSAVIIPAPKDLGFW